jgi:chromosome segregation protein
VRLKKIKLAGFKSFVDPTTLDTPSQLVGVVGPNGCGKSNVMDAVRWVLGESKASELRGESMQDVIFNGAADRKPSARASVELIFDNSLGRIGGSWASYTEISVKRILGRDGQSVYQINNQSVRRRDVYDMFLGTGLGPRAYAIIGQGMISRIIEAKPEELRIFLEEAAGVSKYKERRRETENRLGGTRENLTRVEDILRELNSQIEKLQLQSEVAQQYRDFESDRESKQHMLWIVRRDDAGAEQGRIAQQTIAATLALEERIAELRSLEAQVESLRSEHFAAGDEVHNSQGKYYEVNSEVSRLESEIKFIVESQVQTRERIAGLAAQIDQAGIDRSSAGEAEVGAHAEQEVALEKADVLSQQVLALTEQLPAIESAVRGARTELDTARESAGQIAQAIERCGAMRNSAQAQLEQTERRSERLQLERAAVAAPAEDVVESMREQLAGADQSEHATGERQEICEQEWTQADAARGPAQTEARTAEAKLAQLQARAVALKQLQERVQSQDKLAPWLARHGLDRLGRLWKQVKIDHGWETAVEAVLRERTSALKVETIDRLAALAEDAPPGRVAFFAAAPSAGAPLSMVGGKALTHHIHCSDAGVQAAMANWLHGVFVADSLEAGAAKRLELPPGASFITRDGHVVDRFSIRLYAADSEQDGILARQFELENLEREQRAQSLLSDQARDHAVRVEAIANQRMAKLNQARDDHNQAIRQLTSIKLEAERLSQLSQRVTMTFERVDAELSEVREQRQRALQVIAEESERFEQLDAELAERQQQTEDLVEAFAHCEQALARHREALRHRERDAQEASFATREVQARIERYQAQAEQAEKLITQAGFEQDSLNEKLQQLSDAAAQASLQDLLERRQSAELALTQARSRLDDLSNGLRQKEEQRLQTERSQEPLRQKLSELQLKEQAASLGAQQYAAQLAEANVIEEPVRLAFAEVPKPAWLQAEVTRLTNLVQGLGPVNLAALDELTQSSERKTFLDSQSQDLNEAIATLEDAIRRIDKETRDVLQNTYDAVNRHFGTLFPELFGGGDAKLTLTGSEILDSGIQVMAHPPGKRNASIHLLSGGEKALTAIALVFALFQLNPAPFCLLDEVDAPLDDANTERYCDMVRRMSEHTQFLFITHNKIAMELAQQLVGVTMQERGVSRIVAVDLESATQLAQAA